MKRLTRLLILVVIIIAIFLAFGPNMAGYVKNIFGGIGKSVSIPKIAPIVPAASQAQLVPDTQNPYVNVHLQSRVQGLKPKETYYVSIDQNTCGGPRLVNVSHFQADDSGGGLMDFPFSLNNPRYDAQLNLYMNVHEGGPDGKTVLCSKIDTSLISNSISLIVPASGEALIPEQHSLVG
jgi:hypothetical protein